MRLSRERLMPTLSVNISQEQESAFMEVIDQNPGWNKALVTRALLAYFLKLNPSEQVDLVKAHRIKISKNR